MTANSSLLKELQKKNTLFIAGNKELINLIKVKRVNLNRMGKGGWNNEYR